MVRYCKSKRCLAGKTAIITGANTGIGYETALDFAKRGCRVILACRSEEKANIARDKIFAETDNKNVIVKKLDLESLESVRQFARDIINTEEHLDLLVNNAGAGWLEHKTTEDGLQLLMETNYFSPFLLTILLLDLLKKSAPSRIINVSSAAAKFSDKIKLDSLNQPASKLRLYSRTKLCNILFTVELARRLEETGVTTYSLHPGAIKTEFQRHSSFLKFFSGAFLTPEEGAQTTIYVSVEDGVEKYNGQHFEDCRPVKPYNKTVKDKELTMKLWEVTEKLVGLKAD